MDDAEFSPMPGKVCPRPNGFTLIELLVAITILAILAMLVPSMAGMIERASRDSAQQELISLMSLARSEAIQRQQPVTFCRGGPAACAGNAMQGETRWDGGLMFVDTNQTRSFISADDEVLRYTAFDDVTRVTWSRGDAITFEADGSVTGYSNGTFKLIHRNEPDTVHCLILSLQGRVRSAEQEDCD
ncbi:GspH/FimT family pseudopilin [Marinobacterium mangrovicola]|uniref:Type II secretion system protein H n=1 Tax=Marinobacterium mangrovicola TaxID=1476959 RepID=A0A4R1GGU5_9GAMM|nr:GspH/FimT family pseudopilin [Marinobacterium mangrovicola]TCK05935.1 prepilin-type N-terminal cleavage/methylation domain-containing protein [Marinobacterium mangrovicola]